METVKGPDSSQEYLLTKLIDQYQAVLLQMCFMYLHDRTMAEDAVQETFLKAYRSMTAFRGECSEKTWLTRIAINTCRDMKRSAWFRHMDRRVTPEDMTPIPVQPVEDYDAEELAQHLPEPGRDLQALQGVELPGPGAQEQLGQLLGREGIGAYERWHLGEQLGDSAGDAAAGEEGRVQEEA